MSGSLTVRKIRSRNICISSQESDGPRERLSSRINLPGLTRMKLERLHVFREDLRRSEVIADIEETCLNKAPAVDIT